MQKMSVSIMALAQNDAQQGSFIVLLKEDTGIRRLPVVIGAFEAQAIAVAIEGVKPNRPLTHDLFKNTLEQIGIQLQEVVISDLRDGIFYATLYCLDVNGDAMELDSRTSDALALAVRFGCPISTYEFILEEAGVTWKDSEKEEPVTAKASNTSLHAKSTEELERLLEQALSEEDYERAAKIRDEINRRR